MTTPINEIFEMLQKWDRAQKTPQQIAMRCRIILSYQKRKYPQLVAQDLGCRWNTAAIWIKRWEEAIPNVLEYWNKKGFDRQKSVMKILQDKPRSGREPTYTTEQVTKIIALACQPPAEFGRPITLIGHIVN